MTEQWAVPCLPGDQGQVAGVPAVRRGSAGRVALITAGPARDAGRPAP